MRTFAPARSTTAPASPGAPGAVASRLARVAPAAPSARGPAPPHTPRALGTLHTSLARPDHPRERAADDAADAFVHRGARPPRVADAPPAAARMSPPRRLAGLPPAVSAAFEAPGRPLEAPVRARLEAHFGRPLAHVRVHDDARGAEAAATLRAAAATAGAHIVFARGRYAPATGAGRRLLAHEVAHVVQPPDAHGDQPAVWCYPRDATLRAAVLDWVVDANLDGLADDDFAVVVRVLRDVRQWPEWGGLPALHRRVLDGILAWIPGAIAARVRARQQHEADVARFQRAAPRMHAGHFGHALGPGAIRDVGPFALLAMNVALLRGATIQQAMAVGQDAAPADVLGIVAPGLLRRYRARAARNASPAGPRLPASPDGASRPAPGPRPTPGTLPPGILPTETAAIADAAPAPAASRLQIGSPAAPMVLNPAQPTHVWNPLGASIALDRLPAVRWPAPRAGGRANPRRATTPRTRHPARGHVSGVFSLAPPPDEPARQVVNGDAVVRDGAAEEPTPRGPRAPTSPRSVERPTAGPRNNPPNSSRGRGTGPRGGQPTRPSPPQPAPAPPLPARGFVANAPWDFSTGWLSVHEARPGERLYGGHTLKLHVGLDQAALQQRLNANPTRSSVSTYRSQADAERFTEMVLTANQPRIQQWLAAPWSPAGEELLLQVSNFGVPTGDVLQRGAASTRQAQGAKVQLIRIDEPGQPQRFFVNTSYPN